MTDEVRGLRPIVWRILLNYLPLDAKAWDDTLRVSHDNYLVYKEELITKPTLAQSQANENTGGIRVVSNTDHPLSKQQNSTWKQYYDDKQLWEEIEKDVKRTRNELAFFMQAIDPTRNSPEDLVRLEM